MTWTPLSLTVRVGCNLTCQTTVPTPVLFALKPRLGGRVRVMQEKLSFGIGLPSDEVQDSHGNITYRSMWMPGDNEIRPDGLVAVSSQADNREVVGQILPVAELPFDRLRYPLPSRYCDSDKPMDFHAYCEVYLGQEWLTFDPRFHVSRIGRVKVAHGADAVDTSGANTP
jgi:hypothetical protein